MIIAIASSNKNKMEISCISLINISVKKYEKILKVVTYLNRIKDRIV